MIQVTNPKTGKTYTYGPAKRAQAIELAKKFGVEIVEVPSTKSRTRRSYSSKICVCGRPEDNHESYDCLRDWQRTGGW
jgi:hypothetical protein